MNFVRLIEGAVARNCADFHLYKSYVGKRTDDVGFGVFKKKYNLGHTLTNTDKKEINNRYGAIVKSPISWGYNFFEMVKSLYGFNPDFLPSSYYMPYIFEVLNSPNNLPLLAHKGLHAFFFKGVSQPETIAASIGGILYDNEYHRMSQEDLYLILSHTDFIIKPAHDSSMGRGVKLVRCVDGINLKILID